MRFEDIDYEGQPEWRKARDRRAFKLASTHSFEQSIAMANVCRCGAHRDYHNKTLEAGK